MLLIFRRGANCFVDSLNGIFDLTGVESFAAMSLKLWRHAQQAHHSDDFDLNRMAANIGGTIAISANDV